MITEQHELLSAYFVDTISQTIEALWVDPETKEISQEIIQAKVSDESYRHLLRHTDLIEIDKNTKEKVNEDRQLFLQTVKGIAEAEGLLFSAGKDDDNVASTFNELLFGEEEIDKELLFKIKLKVFELPFVLECKNRSLKAKMRKATTVYEVYTVLFEIKALTDSE